MINERLNVVPLMKGIIKDKIIYEDGRIEVREWEHNTIVNDVAKLLTCLLKGQSGYKGISYWAIGSGLASWDTTTPAPTVNDTGCTTEIFRKAIPVANIKFISDTGEVTSSPTKTIQIDLVFDKGEGTGTWREFSIFGGNATTSPNSGLAINHRTHGRIEKTATMVVERSMRFVFS